MSNSWAKQQFQNALNSLNEVQREAVLSDAQSLQIVAGPGSGKTKVLTCRVAYLITEKNISPSDIIVVTFTKKAAIELKERFSLLIGSTNVNQLCLGTFHSICRSLICQHAELINVEPDFKLIEDKKRREIIKALIADESLPVKYEGRQLKPDIILKEIGDAKERGENWTKFQNLYGGGTSNYKRLISIFYKAYEEEMKNQNLMDYGGLLLKSSELLREYNSILHNVRCLLVDEFQDTNTVQYDLIKLIMDQYNIKTLTTVGDPDQSIYGWRSAKPKIFEEMQDDFNATVTINLEQNYRSTAKIVEAANHVITQDTDRMDKALYTNNPIGIPIFLVSIADEEQQAEYVALEIAKVLDYSKGLIEYKDIAVLMRANYVSRQFERTLRIRKIPFGFKGGDKFFNRMEIKDILSYLRLAYDTSDIPSFDRIINVPQRDIKETTLAKIKALLKRNSSGDIFSAITCFLESVERVFSADRKALIEFVELFDQIRQKMNEKIEIADILKFIYERTNYFGYLKQNYFAEHTGRWKNLGELVSIAASGSETGFYEDGENDRNEGSVTSVVYLDDEEEERKNFKKKSLLFIKEEEETFILPEEDSTAATPTSKDLVKEFLDYCQSCTNQKELKENKGGSVTLSTIHAAKGLEWPCVFIVTCVDGVIPASTADMSEEKRILYVAMTRSKFLLYCISPEEVGDFGQQRQVDRTPYLNDMDNNLYCTSSPVWSRDVLEMLAKTTHRSLPVEDEEFLDNSGESSNQSSSQPTTPSSNNQNFNNSFNFYKPYSSSTISKTKITTILTYSSSSSFSNQPQEQPQQQYQQEQQTDSQSSITSGFKRRLNLDDEQTEGNIIIEIKKERKENDFDL